MKTTFPGSELFRRRLLLAALGRYFISRMTSIMRSRFAALMGIVSVQFMKFETVVVETSAIFAIVFMFVFGVIVRLPIN